jgi:hypothetical protein
MSDAVEPNSDENLATGTAIEDSIRLDAYSEGLLGLTAEVIASRAELLGEAYPFVLSSNAIRYRGSRTHVYEFCLSISSVANIAVPQYRSSIAVFEQLSGLVMSCFIGAPGQYHHTGFPGSGSAIGKHLDALDKLMPGEWKWDEHTLANRANDGGVDVVVYKRADGRRGIGSLMFTGNAGCGRTWRNSNKHRERPSSELAKLLSRPKPWHLHDFLSVPVHLYDNHEWIEASDEGRFVLDRIRLTLIAEALGSDLWHRESARFSKELNEAILLLHPAAKLSE